MTKPHIRRLRLAYTGSWVWGAFRTLKSPFPFTVSINLRNLARNIARHDTRLGNMMKRPFDFDDLGNLRSWLSTAPPEEPKADLRAALVRIREIARTRDAEIYAIAFDALSRDANKKLEKPTMIRYRVWPDGTVQEAEGTEPYSWLSDDYAVVHAEDEEAALRRAALYISFSRAKPTLRERFRAWRERRASALRLGPPPR